MVSKFNIGVPRRSCFKELGETVMYGLRALRYDVQLSEYLEYGSTNILFAAHLAEFEKIPDNTIVYNFEQVGGYPFRSEFLDLVRHCRLWDYSAANVEAWKQRGIEAHLVELGYVPELKRVPRAKEEFDVLFYGMPSLRREAVLKCIAKGGMTMRVLYGYVGKQLDDMIARARIVLNMHNYETKVFEVARVSYLLTNMKCVVTEESTPDATYAHLDKGMAVAPYEDLAWACSELVKDESRRKELELVGHRLFAQHAESEILKEALTA